MSRSSSRSPSPDGTKIELASRIPVDVAKIRMPVKGVVIHTDKPHTASRAKALPLDVDSIVIDNLLDSLRGKAVMDESGDSENEVATVPLKKKDVQPTVGQDRQSPEVVEIGTGKPSAKALDAERREAKRRHLQYLRLCREERARRLSSTTSPDSSKEGGLLTSPPTNEGPQEAVSEAREKREKEVVHECEFGVPWKKQDAQPTPEQDRQLPEVRATRPRIL
ncbi:hypothetical protein JAAARDRAFT_68781 [Jaapia argillacea MUCL 33604]|uniref:Uncharacterized protein n=1 Tax=Jaapia argillacea MUCL 33604 TaxID=933084 RepID=A0A067PWT8_9AGAM|nr:hypothetical protein JAAARDRAFT_68781 [Jaapia argillacea MUCL 33604]